MYTSTAQPAGLWPLVAGRFARPAAGVRHHTKRIPQEPGGNLPGWDAAMVRSGPGDVKTKARESVPGGR